MGCEKCNYTGQIEVDPSNPEETDTQQIRFCDCVFEEAEEHSKYLKKMYAENN